MKQAKKDLLSCRSEERGSGKSRHRWIKIAGFLLLYSAICFYASSQINRSSVFTLSSKADLALQIKKLFSSNHQLQPFTSKEPINGLSLSGEVRLHSDSSLVRVILIDADSNEYLIYEVYPLLVDTNSFHFTNVCEETAFLNNVIPSSVRTEIVDADLYISEILPRYGLEAIAQAQADQIQLQQSVKIDALNKSINRQGLLWLAGETSVSRMSYAEKMRLFGGKVPNLQGFEYYKGGVFSLPGSINKSLRTDVKTEVIAGGSSSYIDYFDWRNRHGKNWVTSVKYQDGCGSCWAFATAGATELLTNLYFNRHIDLDLSEQDLVSCSWDGGCSPWFPGEAANYIMTNGVVDEICFPYDATARPCSEKCTSPSELIKIQSVAEYYVHGEDIKGEIIKGAVIGIMNSIQHAMMFVGYRVLREGDTIFLDPPQSWITIPEGSPYIGKTAWLFKNSWGMGYGDNGYMYSLDNYEDICALPIGAPVQSLVYTDKDIICADYDNDGYYYWGIGLKPSYCPACPDEPDGDDSDPAKGPIDDFGNFLPEMPQAYNLTACSEQPAPPLIAAGENIKWYIKDTMQEYFCDSRDGELYRTVTLGDQVWMAQNLRFQTDEGSWYYSDELPDPDKFSYGRLYNWQTALNVCPLGMHLPGDEEWKDLERFLGMPDPDLTDMRGTNEGGKLKEADTTHWYYPNKLATDEYGFTALPGGHRWYDGTMSLIRCQADFWTSTQSATDTSLAWLRRLQYGYGGIARKANFKGCGFSVRCMNKKSNYHLVHSGDTFYTQYTVPGTYIFYCTQTINNVESPHKEVTLTLLPLPSAPVANDTAVCAGASVAELTAEGTDIKWYADCTNPLYDPRDGQVYKTVAIGNQTWMEENLNYRTSTGSAYYNDDSMTFSDTYGRLYTEIAASGACPPGWKLPSDANWSELIDFLGSDSVAGGKMKEAGTSHWTSPNADATNESGFTALPGGKRDDSGGYSELGNATGFWSGSSPSVYYNWSRRLTSSDPEVIRKAEFASIGLSVRCIYNGSPVATGNHYVTGLDDPGVYSFWVSQKVSGCESPFDTVTVTINPVPPTPATTDVFACEGDTVHDLEATGTYILWYGDSLLANLVHAGECYATEITQPGIYPFYATQTIADCESKSGVAHLTIFALPVVYLGEDTSINTKQNLMLGIDNKDYDYLWSDGSKNSTLVISGSEAGLGDHAYWLIVTDSNSCINSDTIRVAVVNASGLSVLNSGIVLQIYPNPVSHTMYINIAGFDPDDYEVKIIDQQGREVRREKYKVINEKETIDIGINAWPPGCYTLLITGNTIRYSGKIIIY